MIKKKPTKKKKVYYIPGQSEHTIQCEVIDYCDHMGGVDFRKEYTKEEFGSIPCLKWIYACPNGSHKSIVAAVKFKREGLKAGVPDLFLPVPIRGTMIKHGLYIEMKKPGGKLGSKQREWRDYLIDAGYSWAVCESSKEAIEVIRGYLELDEQND